jgi:hypothetical protein
MKGKKDQRPTVAESADFEARGEKAGLNTDAIRQLLTILGPLMMDVLLRWLENRNNPSFAAADHGCESVKAAAHGILAHEDGDHAAACDHFFMAACHCCHLAE